MITLLLAIYLLPQPSYAGWFNNFCQRHLIADDPHPYAEESSDVLLNAYRFERNVTALHELVFRLRAGMLKEREAIEFWDAVRAVRGY